MSFDRWSHSQTLICSVCCRGHRAAAAAGGGVAAGAAAVQAAERGGPLPGAAAARLRRGDLPALDPGGAGAVQVATEMERTA